MPRVVDVHAIALLGALLSLGFLLLLFIPGSPGRLGTEPLVALAVWVVLGAAGVWDSINSIVQQAVGSQDGPQFDVTDYVGTSRVMGFTMIVAVVDVILITAIATLGAFLYNLSAALLGGIEVTLAEDN